MVEVGWNSEVSTSTSKDWIKWRQQLKNVKIPRIFESGDSKGESHTFSFILLMQVSQRAHRSL